MSTTTHLRTHPEPRLTARLVRGLGIAVVAAVLVTVGWLLARDDGTPIAEPVATGAAEQVDPAAETERLARLGQIPAEAHDAEAEATRRLTARGLIPAGAAATSATQSVDAAEEAAVIRSLVEDRAGQDTVADRLPPGRYAPTGQPPSAG